MTQQCKYDCTFEQRATLFWKSSLGRCLHPMIQPCKYDFALEQRTIWLWNDSPRLHRHPMIQPCAYGFTMLQQAIWFGKNILRLHLQPMTQPCKYDLNLDKKGHMIMTSLRRFTCVRWLNHANTISPRNKGPYDYDTFFRDLPASDDSTTQIRLRLKTEDHMIMKVLRDFTCIRWVNHANTISHWNRWPYYYKKVFETSPTSVDSTMQVRIHLRTQGHMIKQHLPVTSPASDTSTVQIRLHLGTKDHMIWKNSPKLHLRPMTQPYKYALALEQRTTWLWNNSPRLHLHPMLQPCKYDLTWQQGTLWFRQELAENSHASNESAGRKDNVTMKNLFEIWSASDDSTMQIRCHPGRTPIWLRKTLLDFTNSRWCNHANKSSL